MGSKSSNIKSAVTLALITALAMLAISPLAAPRAFGAPPDAPTPGSFVADSLSCEIIHNKTGGGMIKMQGTWISMRDAFFQVWTLDKKSNNLTGPATKPNISITLNGAPLDGLVLIAGWDGKSEPKKLEVIIRESDLAQPYALVGAYQSATPRVDGRLPARALFSAAVSWGGCQPATN